MILGQPFGIASGVGTRLLCVLLFLLFLPPVVALSQRSNLEQIQQCARTLADSVLMPFADGDSLRLVVVEHPAGWLIDGQFLEAAADRGLRVTDSPAAPALTVAVTGLGIEYLETEESDRLLRRASLVLNTIVPAVAGIRGSSSRIAGMFATALVDTIEASQAVALESPGYPFSKGMVVSTASPGFWGKIVEPVVVLGASVVMVILLFTVRSQ